jgi:hypothetical protein
MVIGEAVAEILVVLIVAVAVLALISNKRK